MGVFLVRPYSNLIENLKIQKRYKNSKNYSNDQSSKLAKNLKIVKIGKLTKNNKKFLFIFLNKTVKNIFFR